MGAVYLSAFAEQASRCSAFGWSSPNQRHTLAVLYEFSLGGCAGAVWAFDNLLQSLCKVAQSRRLGPNFLADISKAFDGDIIMIDSSCVGAHQHGATAKMGALTKAAWDIPVAG